MSKVQRGHKLTLTSSDLTPKSISEVLKTAVRDTTAPIQTLAWKLKRSPSTVKNWWSGRSEPSATDLIAMMREFDEIYDAVIKETARLPEEEVMRRARQQILRELAGDNTDL